MKICLVGEFSGNTDEGVRTTASCLARELLKNNEILTLDLKLGSSLRPATWNKIKAFRPQIVHYLPGPTLLSFPVTRFMGALGGHAGTVVSATHPRLPVPPFDRFISLVRPDLILAQSQKTRNRFAGLGCRTELLLSGVDTKRFAPVSKQVKDCLRDKYGVSKDSFIAIHVGHLSKGRNLGLLADIQDSGCQVIVAASTSIKMDGPTHRALQGKGCVVWNRYFENIEEVYNLSDCYVFPTVSSRGAPELPLSVMEAMACNLPVVSTKFGGLPEFFSEGEGLHFATGELEILKCVAKVRVGGPVKTREKALPYSWENIARQLEGMYRALLT